MCRTILEQQYDSQPTYLASEEQLLVKVTFVWLLNYLTGEDYSM